MARPNGVILWQGASLLDGAPIVAIATFGRKSRNAKTGDMLQTWILRADVSPVDAVKSGADASICGDCKHRGAGNGKGRSCYVTVFQAPYSVYKAFRRGSYPAFDAALHGQYVAGRAVRLGAYGDPAAVPVATWESLLAASGSAQWTGYTHQWRKADAALSRLVMASCDTPDERAAAVAMGWRTFRVRLASEELMPREVVCPASAEAGAKTDCASCRSCNGNATARKGTIAIVIHGAVDKTRAYQGLRAS